MAYKKFDDASPKVDQSARKVYATPEEKFRRAFQGIANRVVGSTSGTASHLLQASLGTASTGAVQITNTLVVLINGAYSTCIAQDNLNLPKYTQAKNTVVKYLLSTGTGTSGTVTGPGNEVSKADYATVALANAAAKLPDLPDGNCALGYITVNAPETLAVVNNAAGLGAPAGTQGTATFTNLVCMPYND